MKQKQRGVSDVKTVPRAQQGVSLKCHRRLLPVPCMATDTQLTTMLLRLSQEQAPSHHRSAHEQNINTTVYVMGQVRNHLLTMGN